MSTYCMHIYIIYDIYTYIYIFSGRVHVYARFVTTAHGDTLTNLNSSAQN